MVEEGLNKTDQKDCLRFTDRNHIHHFHQFGRQLLHVTVPVGEHVEDVPGSIKQWKTNSLNITKSVRLSHIPAILTRMRSYKDWENWDKFMLFIRIELGRSEEGKKFRVEDADPEWVQYVKSNPFNMSSERFRYLYYCFEFTPELNAIIEYLFPKEAKQLVMKGPIIIHSTVPTIKTEHLKRIPKGNTSDDYDCGDESDYDDMFEVKQRF